MNNANLIVPANLDPMDFYEEFFEWIMDKYPGPKDYHITLYEDSDVFDIFIEMKHPELMVADD